MRGSWILVDPHDLVRRQFSCWRPVCIVTVSVREAVYTFLVT
jgi:hypothetical protein